MTVREFGYFVDFFKTKLKFLKSKHVYALKIHTRLRYVSFPKLMSNVTQNEKFNYKSSISGSWNPL